MVTPALAPFAIDAFDAATTARIEAAMRAASGEAATVTGMQADAAVLARVRSATTLAVPAALRALVTERVGACRDALAGHFGLRPGALEEANFLRYVAGDLFVAHQDGNTPLIHDDTRLRTLSVVVFVNGGGDYGGGELVLHGPFGSGVRHVVEARPGRLVAFRAETTHEVLPVTRGERYTIATWFR